MRFVERDCINLQQKNHKAMKLSPVIILFLMSFSLNACSGTFGDKSNGGGSDAMVITLTSESFRKLVWDYEKNPKAWVFNGDQPVVIDFYTDWCGPCKMVAPVMEQLAKEYKGKIRIYKVNTDQQRELAGIFNITSIPAVLFVPNPGKPQMSVGAMQKKGYVDLIKNVLNVK